MKNLKKFLKNTSVFVAVSILIAMFIFVAIAYLLVLPKFQSYSDFRSQNKRLQEDINELEKSINVVSSLDREEVGKFYSIINILIPEVEDTLRFVTLSEVVADLPGVNITKIEIKAQTTRATQTTSAQPIQAASESYEVGISVGGQF